MYGREEGGGRENGEWKFMRLTRLTRKTARQITVVIRTSWIPCGYSYSCSGTGRAGGGDGLMGSCALEMRGGVDVGRFAISISIRRAPSVIDAEDVSSLWFSMESSVSIVRCGMRKIFKMKTLET